MDALVMCGGQGTRLRLAAGEKPLLTICGQPMFDHVVDTLSITRIDTVYAVVSPHTPETAAHARNVRDIPTIETPGEGYVADLDYALSHVDRPVLTVVADLPLLDSETLDAVLCAFDGNGSRTVCVPVERKRELGVSVDSSISMNNGSERKIIPSGLNIVADNKNSDNNTNINMIRDSYRLAVNVNRLRDAQIAEALCD